MILVINYADVKYRQAQIMCTASAKHFGADQVLEYSPQSIPPDFYAAHKHILEQPRGNGYWLWKPLIILDALSRVADGDLVFYIDSGAAFIDDIHLLTDAMLAADSNIMTFTLMMYPERYWTKRDAFLLMDCDSPEFTDTPQLASGYEIFRKSDESIAFVREWLSYMTDARIVTDMPNQLGQPNYPGFIENRHDQTVLSLLSKKKKLPLFKFPAEDAPPPDDEYFRPIIERSPYPQVIDSHRRRNWTMTFDEYLKLNYKRPTLKRGIESVCLLLDEKLYSEALSLLDHIVKNHMGGGGCGIGMSFGS